jgi:hypothetical protein
LPHLDRNIARITLIALVWVEQKTDATSTIFTFKDYFYMISHKTTMFLLHQSKALDESFPMRGAC